MTWRSTHPDVGSGIMTVTEFVPGRRIATGLDIPGMGKATSYFDLVPTSTGTDVTWGFSAELQNPLERWMCALLDFDNFIGKDYERGLEKLKAVAEQAP
jgi:polyketide cyclase/dehydrase/lipid transport protein